MKLIAALSVLVMLACSMPAVHAHGDPSIEVCTQYAEADAVFEKAETEAEAVYESNMREAESVVEAAMHTLQEKAIAEAGVKDADDEEAVYEAIVQRIFAEPEYVSAVKEADAVYDAAMKEAEAVRISALEEANRAIIRAYLAVYIDGDGKQSDLWEIMEKLLAQALTQRQRCEQLYDL